MPTYDYKCDACESIQEEFHGMTETPEIHCKNCNGIMQKTVCQNFNGFILKGSGWTGKDLKEKTYQLDKRREIGKKMALNHDIPQILPNYKGEVCSSWDDAKKLAKEDGVDGLRYEKQVQDLKKQEHTTKEKVNNLIKGTDNG